MDPLEQQGRVCPGCLLVCHLQPALSFSLPLLLPLNPLSQLSGVQAPCRHHKREWSHLTAPGWRMWCATAVQALVSAAPLPTALLWAMPTAGMTSLLRVSGVPRKLATGFGLMVWRQPAGSHHEASLAVCSRPGGIFYMNPSPQHCQHVRLTQPERQNQVRKDIRTCGRQAGAKHSSSSTASQCIALRPAQGSGSGPVSTAAAACLLGSGWLPGCHCHPPPVLQLPPSVPQTVQAGETRDSRHAATRAPAGPAQSTPEGLPPAA